jgi:hypothetical protein
VRGGIVSVEIDKLDEYSLTRRVALGVKQLNGPHSIGFSGSEVQGRIDSLPTSGFAG